MPRGLPVLLPLLLGLVAVVVGGLHRRRRRVFGPAEGVLTDDGFRLHVEEDGVPDAPVTVVFSHGFTAHLGEFRTQREALRSRARLVLYDQRGHGRSPLGDPKNATIGQLAKDLAAVLEQRGGPGPVVLVGHSMGGITLMALARQRPELFGRTVAGAFLLATSAGDLVTGGLVGLAARVGKRLGLLPLWLRLLRLTSPLAERMRRRGTRAGYLFIRHYLFGCDDADPATVREVQALLEECPVTTAAAFYPSFVEHDETAALPVFRTVPTTVLVGDCDRLTPASHSRRMAELIGGDVRLVVVPGAGHSVNVTRSEVVDRELLDLVARVTPVQQQAG